MKKALFLLIVLIGFTACDGGKRYHDKGAKLETPKEKPKSVYEQTKEFQKDINAEFFNPKKSPLKKEDLAGFRSLDFFPIDTSYNVMATLVRTPNPVPIIMPTTTGGASQEIIYGVLHFELDGKAFQLNVYQNLELRETEEYRDFLFLPFSDLTNGEETYGGGRYLDLSIPEGDQIAVNFNMAYNPYCAYNEKYSCPIVPAENTLDYPIRAGVKNFISKAK